MIDTTKYKEEAKALISNFVGNKERLEVILNKIYAAVVEKKYNKADMADMSNEAISTIFKNPYSNDPMIPASFLGTEIGKAIMLCKYQTPRIYTVREVAEFVGCTVQQIYKDRNKSIRSIEEDLNLFYEDEVAQYLEKKNIPVETMYK